MKWWLLFALPVLLFSCKNDEIEYDEYTLVEDFEGISEWSITKESFGISFAEGSAVATDGEMTISASNCSRVIVERPIKLEEHLVKNRKLFFYSKFSGYDNDYPFPQSAHITIQTQHNTVEYYMSNPFDSLEFAVEMDPSGATLVHEIPDNFVGYFEQSVDSFDAETYIRIELESRGVGSCNAQASLRVDELGVIYY